MFICLSKKNFQWRIQDFPDGRHQLQVGVGGDGGGGVQPIGGICFYLGKSIFFPRFTFYKQIQTRIKWPFGTSDLVCSACEVKKQMNNFGPMGWCRDAHWRIQGWRQGRAPPPFPNSFIFMQFSVKIWPNNRLVLPSWKLAPHLGNPGSATDAYSPITMLHFVAFFFNWVLITSYYCQKTIIVKIWKKITR